MDFLLRCTGAFSLSCRFDFRFMDVQKTMDSFVLPLDKVKIVCYHFNKLKKKLLKEITT